MRTGGKHCGICGKGSMQRNLVSHSKRVAIRHAFPNLRRMRVLSKGRILRIFVCAKCLKKGKVQAALPRRLTKAPAAV